MPFLAMGPDDIWVDPKVRSIAWAAARGKIGTIDKLYNEGIDVNTRGAFGATPLWWPLQRQNKEGFRKLLELGANPNIAYDGGLSIMSYVVQLEDPFYYKQAIAQGGDPFYFSETGNNTLLLWATRTTDKASIKVIESLIDKGVDLDVQDNVGATAMIRAVFRDRHDIAYKILSSGGNPFIKTMGGLSVRDLVLERKGFEIGKPGMPEWRAKFIQLLSEKGIEVE